MASMNRRLIAAATIVLVGGVAVAVFGSVERRSHPHPAPSSQHAAGIDHAMSAVLVLYHAPVGATPCESAYNAFKASLDLSNEQHVTAVVTWLAPHDDFIARCAALPAKSQQCVVPIYLAEHRAECASAKPPDDVLKAMAQMKQVAEPFIRRRAIRHLEKGRVVIFAGGTGNPYFSTDTAASLRAMEIKAEAILKATRVDGIYDADPLKVDGAKKFNHISYMDVLKLGLKVMDSTAISLCKDNNLPIIVFNLNHHGNIRRVVLGEKIGSRVSAKGE